MSETQQETPEAVAVQAPDDVDDKISTGLGLYNVTLQRFVGGKFATKADATAYAKAKGDPAHEFALRKV